MKTPLLKPLLITSLPVFASVFTAASIVWQLGEPKLAMPFVLGIIAGGLVDLDNRLTGRLKNIIATVALFTLSSLTAQSTLGTGLPFILAMTLMTFGFTILGAVGLKYRTFAFGALAVATYTTLTYTPETYWLTNPFMILCGTVLYSTAIILFQIILPHRPVQESVANAYDALGGYLEAKADFFDPDEAEWIGNRHIDLAMSNTGVITAFNQCRSALFYRLRGKHRHPRTAKMLRYYFAAQDIHERISSAHVDYQEMSEKFKNTDIIFRIHRLLEMQGQACRNTAQALRASKDYVYSKRLGRAIEGCRQSLRLLSDSNDSPDIRHLRRLLDNLGSVDQQFRQLQHNGLQAENDRMGDTRIAALETGSLKNTWQAIRPQLNLESGVFRHAVRLSLVVAAACTIVEALNLNLGYWILLTALFVCQPNYTATKSRVRQRIAGTVLGVIVGSLVPYFTPSVETKLWIVIVSTTLFFMTRTYKYSFSTFFITIQALTSLSLAGLDVYAAMPVRIIDTIIGASLAWAAVSYLWPDWKYLTLERTAALSSTLSDMSSEPAKFADSLQPGFTLLKTGYALTGYISALGAYRSEMHEECSPDFTAQFHLAAEHTAHIFQHLPETEPDDFQTALDTLRGELDTLRTHSSGTQSHILLQQLQLIARQLEPYYRAYRQIPHRQPQNAA
ncbi:YccS family putative transporter [Neisseria meningitidis]|uniref:YccS family putative transporter n=1 Tax=Neisseria meningitidis TaxID=487 RepID=UPI0021F22D3A|nr:YccS family putative transporter [Neisseria meningitidis]MCV6698643.1 YccS family putative transporter [Neisseria meningitidis]MCV6702725.1 YccS family putative transporter [Neisseria meningitidis]MCV6704773.1 YccS family putative transporter [Neisseria meningitidis]MCV6710302.1 YccS family putative transporter [Neisseria meningitidis]